MEKRTEKQSMVMGGGGGKSIWNWGVFLQSRESPIHNIIKTQTTLWHDHEEYIAMISSTKYARDGEVEFQRVPNYQMVFRRMNDGWALLCEPWGGKKHLKIAKQIRFWLLSDNIVVWGMVVGASIIIVATEEPTRSPLICTFLSLVRRLCTLRRWRLVVILTN